MVTYPSRLWIYHLSTHADIHVVATLVVQIQSNRSKTSVIRLSKYITKTRLITLYFILVYSISDAIINWYFNLDSQGTASLHTLHNVHEDLSLPIMPVDAIWSTNDQLLYSNLSSAALIPDCHLDLSLKNAKFPDASAMLPDQALNGLRDLGNRM